MLATVLVVSLGFWLFDSRSSEASLSEDDEELDPSTREELKQVLNRGRFKRAGEILMRVGQYEEAGDHFARASAPQQAADAYLKAECRPEAIHYFKEAGVNRQAARLYADDEHWRAAAAEYVKAGDHHLAGKYYEEARDARRAAKHYRQSGNLVDAARNLEEIDEKERAAETYEDLLDHHLEGDDELDSERAEEVAKRAASLWRDVGEQGRAASLYRRIDAKREAAEALVDTNRSAEAAELFMELGERKRAAEVLEASGASARASETRAKMALEQDDYYTAAKLFADADKYEKAAHLFDKELADEERAAEAYEKAERWLRAAELYEHCDRQADAAHCAEQGGELVKAAELYRDVGDIDGEIRTRISQGDYFRAGRLLYEQRRQEDALETLKRINSRDPIYPRSLVLQGDIYRHQKRYEKAYSRYRAAVEQLETKQDHLSLYYKMARVCEAGEEFERALDHYDKILRLDESYEDVADRASRIREGLQANQQPDSLRSPSAEVGDPRSVGAEVPPDETGEETGASLRYEFEEEIAKGGMGVVYRARDTFLNRIVAVKLLGEDLRDNETAVEYFLREARAAAALSHPNIVTIFDAGEQQGEYYIAMEYVEGKTLKNLIQDNGPLTESAIREIAIQSCRALKYAHAEGVLHRDIKSDNIMCRPDRTIKVMDFGLAKFLREYTKEHTKQVGTPYYMSPEQIIGKDVDFRSDLYGLGCTLFECLTGRVPFTDGELSYHHVHTEPPSPRDFNEDVSETMEDLVMTLLEKEPENRFQSAEDLLETLDDLELEGEGA